MKIPPELARRAQQSSLQSAGAAVSFAAFRSRASRITICILLIDKIKRKLSLIARHHTSTGTQIFRKVSPHSHISRKDTAWAHFRSPVRYSSILLDCLTLGITTRGVVEASGSMMAGAGGGKFDAKKAYSRRSARRCRRHGATPPWAQFGTVNTSYRFSLLAVGMSARGFLRAQSQPYQHADVAQYRHGDATAGRWSTPSCHGNGQKYSRIAEAAFDVASVRRRRRRRSS